MTFSKNLIRRLIQAKQIFMHGKSHSLRAGEFNRLQAILSLDQAVELFLFTILIEFNSDLKEKTFKEIWDSANICVKENRIGKKLGVSELPLKTDIMNFVHKLRNNAQHNGIIPSESDLMRAQELTEEFLRRAFMLCFEKDFHNVFLADAIIYPDIRCLFQEAEEAFNKKDLEGALVGIAKCHAFFKSHLSKNLPWDDTLELRTKSNPYGAEGIEELIELIKYVDLKVNIFASGGNLQDYKLFEEKAPVVNISQKGNIVGIHLKGSAVNEQECLRMFNLIYNMILHCQSFEARDAIKADSCG